MTKMPNILLIITFLSSTVTVVYADDYRETALPFEGQFLVKKGDGYSERMDENGKIIQSCKDISVEHLNLDGHEVRLISPVVTSDCMLGTVKYGLVRIKYIFSSGSFEVLLTEAQEKAFKEFGSGSAIFK